MDDIILIQSNTVLSEKTTIGEHLDVEDIGVLISFIGVMFCRESWGSLLTQPKYFFCIQNHLVMCNCRAVAPSMT